MVFHKDEVRIEEGKFFEVRSLYLIFTKYNIHTGFTLTTEDVILEILIPGNL